MGDLGGEEVLFKADAVRIVTNVQPNDLVNSVTPFDLKVGGQSSA
jgi:hypothetical protein